MKVVLLVLSSLILFSCTTRGPAESTTWKQAEDQMNRPEFMNRSK